MSFFWSSARKDFRRYTHDRLALLLWLAIPLVIGTLLISISGGRGGPRPSAHLLIYDADRSFASRMLAGAFSQIPEHLIEAETVDRATGFQRINSGQASAFLVIPQGFSRALLLEEPATLELWTNPSQAILPRIIRSFLGVLVDGAFYLQRIAGPALREAARDPDRYFSLHSVGEVAETINALARRVARYLDPPLLQLENVEKRQSRKSGSGSLALFFVPGMLFMSLLFMAQGLSEDLWKERSSHTLRRVLVSPRPLFSFLAGKAAASASLMLLVLSVALGFAFLYFHLPWRDFLPAILWCLLAGLLLAQLMVWIQLRASSERGGKLLTLILVFPLMMLGGSFFPFEVMPPWMASLGRLTPNGWALIQLQEILAGHPLAPLAWPALALATLAFLLFLLNALHLRSRLQQGSWL